MRAARITQEKVIVTYIPLMRF